MTVNITVNEALQLKNQLQSDVQAAARTLQYSKVVKVLDADGNEITDSSYTSLPEAIANYIKVSTMFANVNNALNAFTTASGISALVADLKVVKEVTTRLERALEECVERTIRTNGYDANRQVLVVTTKQVPIVTKDYLKKEIKAAKKEARRIQARIFELNAQHIEIIGLDEEDLG